MGPALSARSSFSANSSQEVNLSVYKRRAWYPILAVGISMVAFIIIKTGRDALFFERGGLYELPLAYVYIALVSLPAAIVHLAAIERWGARRTRTGLFFLAALLLLLFVPLLHGNQRAVLMAFFAFVPSIFAAVFAGAWLLAGDLLEGGDEEIKRWSYSRIGAASMIGGIVGGIAAREMSQVVAPPLLVACGSAVLIGVGMIVAWAHRSHPGELTRPSQTGEASNSDRLAPTSPLSSLRAHAHLLGQPFLRALLSISGLAAVAALFIDFQFYAAATLSGNSSARFFADFYIVLNAASLALQLAAGPWLQSRFGVGGALMLLPVALLGTTGMFSILGTVQSPTILRIVEGGLKASIHRSVWEQTFLPFSQRSRDAAKVIVDGLFAKLSEGIAAASLFLWVRQAYATLTPASLNWISWVIIGAVLGWVAVTRYLNRIGCSDISQVESMIRLPDG